MHYQQLILKILKKKWWCSEYGYYCKSAFNCEHEHYKIIPEFCNARLDFSDGGFGFCEKFKNHKDNHRCLFWEWEGSDITVHSSERYKAWNLFKLRLERRG